MENLSTFKLRMAGVPLSKSLDPEHFKGIVNESDPKGGEVVDHTQELSAHPPAIDPHVQRYRAAIAGNSPVVQRAPVSLHGVTAKTVLALPTADNMTKPSRVIIKPYHEVLNPRAEFWQHHPIQGWAEMTNQALWHAADMGHMHQNVHVSEHAMGPGHEKEPGLVIHMAPDADLGYRMKLSQYDPDMQEDLTRIGVMDFLANNLDRHEANLMFRPRNAVDENGQPFRSRLLAIDHGRAFQYHASNKGAPSRVQDPILGTIDVDSDLKEQYNRSGKSGDNLLSYVDARGLQPIAMLGQMFGKNSPAHPNFLVPIIAKWWPHVRDSVVNAMDRRIMLLREPRMQEHVRKNFMERVQLLDKIANDPQWYLTQGKVKDLKVPLHVWDRSANENRNP